MGVVISVRGQTVIPSEIRKKYNITPKSKIEFLDTGKEIVIIPLPKDSFLESRGILKGVTTEDLIEERRKERKYEHKS